MLVLPTSSNGVYEVGDIYVSKNNHIKEKNFDGLEIKSIDYVNGVRLHFDWNDWLKNKTKKRW